MSTTEQKLELLLNTKTRLKEVLNNKGGTITDDTPFSDYPEIADNLSGGGSSAKVEVKSIGNVPVPNTDYVETINFNTNLTTQEVIDLIKNANLTFLNFNGYTAYPILVTETNKFFVILDYSSFTNTPDCYLISEFSSDKFIFVAPNLTEALGLSSGWQDGVANIEVKENAVATYEGMDLGTENDKLVNLVSIIGEITVEKTLEGTYEGVELDITENKQVDLLEYIDNQQMPISVNVNVAGGGSASIEKEGSFEAVIIEETQPNGVYLNYNLSIEEVVNIIKNANLTWSEMDGLPVYCLYCYKFNDNNIYPVFLCDYSSATGYDDCYAIISMGAGDLFMTHDLSEFMGKENIVGWADVVIETEGNIFKQFTDENIELKSETTYEGIPVGQQNEALKELFNVGGSEGYYKELKVKYKPVEIEINENTEVDLVSTYIDNQQMPTSVKVNVSSGSSGKPIEISSSEEMDALLIDENIGKIYLYMGETTETYTNGKIYIVEGV